MTIEIISKEDRADLLVNGRRYISEDGSSKITVNKEAVATTNAATLTKDEWIHQDAAIVEVQEAPLEMVELCNRLGLVSDLPDALGTLEIEYQTVNKTEGAIMAMDFEGQTQDSDVQFGLEYVPVPVIFADYELSDRRLKASRKGNAPLDTTLAVNKARNVMEQVEDALLSADMADGRGHLYGILSYPYNFTISSGLKWTAATKTGVGIWNDVQAMVKTMRDANYRGTFVLITGEDYAAVLDNDYNTVNNFGKTIKSRVLENRAIAEIAVVAGIPADTVILLKKDKEVFCLKRGMPLTMWQTSANHESIHKFRIGTIQFPMMKHDANNTTGVLVQTFTDDS